VVRRLITDAGDGTDAAAVYRWALYDRNPLTQSGDGPVTLLGDAAHPMLPFMGQGACQAIEDGAVLAACLRQLPDPVSALRRYEDLRRERTARVQLAARRNEPCSTCQMVPTSSNGTGRLPRRARNRPSAAMHGCLATTPPR
jgi:2-polyprenyl-6-methoxyphenol hydroxylase-like FAD-dependent oxidoreductase